MDEDLAKFFYEVGQLKLVKRAGWWMAGVRDPESVAEHSYRVAVIGYVLARLAGADPAPVVLAALFHDLAEARTTDLHRVAGRYLGAAKGPAEAAALGEALARLPDAAATPVHQLLDPARRDPVVTRLLKDADSLEMLFQALEYRANGYQGVQEWIDSALGSLQTEHARRIGVAAVAMEPTAWFAGLKQQRHAADDHD